MVLIAIFPLSFYNIEYIASHFLAKSIQKIKDRFDISPLVTSFTLIPLANGAPDLMVAIASSEIEDGVYLAIGSLLGSFLFSATLVASFVIKASNRLELKIPKNVLFKELCFYLFTLIILIYFGFKKTLSLYHALGLIGIYLLYILISLIFFSSP